MAHEFLVSFMHEIKATIIKRYFVGMFLSKHVPKSDNYQSFYSTSPSFVAGTVHHQPRGDSGILSERRSGFTC